MVICVQRMLFQQNPKDDISCRLPMTVYSTHLCISSIFVASFLYPQHEDGSFLCVEKKYTMEVRDYHYLIIAFS
jgi:hypothetical protein